MRLVADTSVLIAGLLRDGVTRALLTGPKVEVHVPDHAHDEVLRQWPLLQARLALPPAEARELVAGVLAPLVVVPASSYIHELADGVRVVAPLDPDDVPFLALARALGCPLWSNDKRLREQAWVEVVTTPEVLRRLDG